MADDAEDDAPDPQLLAEELLAEDPWRTLRRAQDRRRYLRVVTPRRTGKEKPRRPSPAAGVDRARHPLLGSPASVTRRPGHVPDQQDVRGYLRHSADLTMRGGNSGGLVYPLAACALAEHYVFRRIGGSSTGAIPAAATAAAELGRGAPDPSPAPKTPGVVPGFAGLAQAVGWLAGEDLRRDVPAGAVAPASGERLARMIRPAPQSRGLYRLLVAGLRAPGSAVLPALLRLAAAAVTAPGRLGRGLVLASWIGALAAWLWLTTALVEASRQGTAAPLLTVGATLVLLVTCVLGACFLTALVVGTSVARRVHGRADDDAFGLVPGTGAAAPSGRLGRLADRLAGVPAAGDAPALGDWVADRIDDLAGIPAGEDRRPLTFGDLWLGSTAGRGPEQNASLRLAAVEPEHRAIDLVLVATDLSERRPYRFPLQPADLAERSGGARLLFCETCLADVLPTRVVTQLVKSAPSTDVEHSCPRHTDGVLRELPDPWDLPVALAVRLSCSPPGLMRAVPLYTLEEPRQGARHDRWGGEVDPAGGVTDGPSVVRTHWFADGGITVNMSAGYFDTLLPRWPTFGLGVEHAPDDAPDEAIRLPAQDAAPSRRTAHTLRSGGGFAASLLESWLGWRDSGQSELPGFRGRLALIRTRRDERRHGFLLPDEAVLAVAMRGMHAGSALRQRFTGSDGGVPGQSETDRYRWIRLRMALREYRALSVDIGARLPLYRDLASVYHVPAALSDWFDPPLPLAERDPVWAEAVTVVTTLRALSTGGVLDFDVDRGAPPVDPDLRIMAPE